MKRRHLSVAISLLLLLPNQAKASSLFVPDSDTALLLTLVTDTSATLAHTLEILEVAKETKEKMDKYNHLALRKFYMARRVERHLQDMIAISKLRPKNLKELNRALYRLKVNIKNLKRNIDGLGLDVVRAQNFVDDYGEKIEDSKEDERDVNNREKAAAMSGMVKDHIQNMALSSALNGKLLAKIRRDNLNYRQMDIRLKKRAAEESFRKQRFYLNWLETEENND